MRFLSPLRYPGGKSRLAPFIEELIEENALEGCTYVEPFAGGAGVALRLLFDEYVDFAVINDLHPGIAAFWRSAIYDSGRFIDLLNSTAPTIAVWEDQRSILCNPQNHSDLEVGFATFFLNRTNRSGILGARPIGGLDQQGRWAIGARFNREDLARRIRLLARYRDRIEVRETDAIDVILKADAAEPSFFYIDPPYLNHGSDLYLDQFTWAQHTKLASAISELNSPWMVTYDHDHRVAADLFPGIPAASFHLAHSAAIQHIGSELAIFSPSLGISSLDSLGRSGGTWLAAA